MVSQRNRTAQTTTVAYDNLSRPTLVDAPSGTMDVALTYDNLGRTLTRTGNSQTLTTVWDPLSRLTSETGPLGTMSYQYDAAGAMTRITWPDTVYAQYDRDLYGAVTAIRENGAGSGPGVLATYGYNDLGQTTSITRGNGATTAYGYDAAYRMTSLAHDMAGSGSDVTFGYSWNPAGQIASRTVSNNAYVLAPVTGTTGYANDGLNRVTSVGGSAVSYDPNQNITAALGNSYSYDAANRLTSATVGGTGYSFSYDPAGRLSTSGYRLQYAGDQLVGHYDGSGNLVARHVPGPGLDQIVISIHDGGSVRQQQIADERGSVIGLTNASGGLAGLNRYDEYGVPASGNSDAFQYTGQAWMAPGLYNYRARAYAPELGRFLQTDPIGYAGGQNVYSYVGGDPVNLVDPAGTNALCPFTGTYQTFAEGGEWQTFTRVFWGPCPSGPSMIEDRLGPIPRGGGIGRGDGTVVNPWTPPVAPPPFEIPSDFLQCEAPNGTLGQIADGFEQASTLLGLGAVASSVGAIGTSETIVGGFTRSDCGWAGLCVQRDRYHFLHP